MLAIIIGKSKRSLGGLISVAPGSQSWKFRRNETPSPEGRVLYRFPSEISEQV